MSLPPDRNYFKEYKGDCTVFIETGTYRGEGMIAAREAGFHEIHSIDIVEHPDILFKYDGVGTAKRYIQDSAECLEWLLPNIKEPYMIWLDAHSQMLEGEDDNYPLMNEIGVIIRQKNKPNVVMVDDWLYMTHPDVTGFIGGYMITLLKQEGYKIKLLPNPIKNNILLAYV